MGWKLTLIIIIATLNIKYAGAQSNCSHPSLINICPSQYLPSESNAGMGDDAPPGVNIPGEDVLYEIHVPLTTSRIFVTLITNLASPIKATLLKDSCKSTSGVPKFFSTVLSANDWTVSGSTVYWLWVDCNLTASYSISFGADTSVTLVNHPDTQGTVAFDSSGCTSVPFMVSKPYYQVTYNNVLQTHPMTLAPLNVPGTMCLTSFFKNVTGDEGIRTMSFLFDAGYTNIIAPDSIPGRYNSGYWIKSGSGNYYFYTFYDATNSGRGDFTGNPKVCLQYEFCFGITPTSNSPSITNVKVIATTDGYGSAFNGNVYSGCCPLPFPVCHFGSAGSASGINAFSFGINDPPSPLPVDLLSFDVHAADNAVLISWTTASESNNDFFTIEWAAKDDQWNVLDKIKGAGNSSSIRQYTYSDLKPLEGISYYRLKQTDFNGNYKYYPASAVHFYRERNFNIYPNPASEIISIEGTTEGELKVELYSVNGQQMNIPVVSYTNGKKADISAVSPGIYLLIVKEDELTVFRKRITVSGR